MSRATGTKHIATTLAAASVLALSARIACARPATQPTTRPAREPATQPAASRPVSAPESAADDQLRLEASIQRTRESLRELWRSTVSSPVESGEDAHQGLDEAIRQLNSTLPKVEKAESASRYIPYAEDAPPEDEATAPHAELAAKAQTAGDKPAKSAHTNDLPETRGLSSVALEELAEVAPRHPQQVVLLADELFDNGWRDEAARLYRAMVEVEDPEIQAWSLFQLGNSLRFDDPQAAGRAYNQLMADHPSSKWTAVAQVRQTLLGWQQRNRPDLIVRHYTARASDAGKVAPGERPFLPHGMNDLGSDPGYTRGLKND
jgi:hypothetical protein